MSRLPSAPGPVASRFSRPVGWVRDRPIWTKLGLIMIVPTIATIVVGIAGLLNHVQEANNADRARTLTVLSGDADNLVHKLQDERAIAIRLLDASPLDVGATKATYIQKHDETDKANGEYRLGRSTLADVPDNMRALLDRIEAQLGELPVMRGQIESRTKIPLSIAERRYRVLISDLLDIRNLSAQLTGDVTLADRMRAAADVANAKEFLSQERVVVLQALASKTDELSEAARSEYLATRKGQEMAMGAFATVATPDQRELFDRTITGPDLRETLQFEGALDSLRANQAPVTAVPPDKWDRAMTGRSDLMNVVQADLNGQAQQAAIDLGERVQGQVLLETGVLLVTLLLGVLFAWMVARSMARSLRDLRQGALAVAQYGLPQAVARLRDPAISMNMSPASVALQIAEPLPVRSKDEFGQVTEAFNAVHLEAVRTAAEQAALRSSVATMFVNLARRSQILVDRLIGHLDRLERGEQDPDRLSELFQLDHLATRMRRNDENLLVLAGADSTRIQREPAALMDVLRAAQSEVEHYTRIEFGVIDQDIEIAAQAVNDLVHLVAELFDNATAFSPPDTSIAVEARRVGDRAVLQVEDRGIGMSPEQYSELNERLASPPQVDVAVSRMMGLVVVARLASRHGVKVEVRPAQGRGTVADVLMPANVLVPRALAGRTHAPIGFPASRTAATPQQRPLFGPPLALESGAGAGPSWSTEEWRGSLRPHGSDLSAPPSGPPPFGGVPSFGGAPSFGGPPPAAGPSPAGGPGLGGPGFGGAGFAGPAYGGPTFGGPPAAAGLGAALSDEFGGPPSGPSVNGVNGHGSRSLPAWHDLTGAGGPADSGPTPGVSPGETDPLPQRRPGVQWGAPESDEEPTGGFDLPPASAFDSGFSGGFDHGLGGGFAGSGGFGTPPAPPPRTNAPPSFPTMPPAVPPLWPPPVPDSSGSYPSLDLSVERVPTLPDTLSASLSASLDLTAEIPRMRGESSFGRGGAGSSPSRPEPEPAPSAGFDDLTMELPIFRELESAWFRADEVADQTPAPTPAAAAGDDWAHYGTGGSAAVSSTTTPSGGSYRPGRNAGPDGASASPDAVSWRSVADDGWLAAQAAAAPEDGGSTENGLPRRVPMAQLVPGGVEVASGGSDRRTPDAVRGLLSAYHRGVRRGRGAHSNAAEPSSTDSQTSGKEQEA